MPLAPRPPLGMHASEHAGGQARWAEAAPPVTADTQVGQGLWCLAHTVWVGNSVVLAASVGLMAHHLFGCWHGDQRLKAKYGDAFEQVKARTSVVPFQAIWEGRQVRASEGAGQRDLPRWPPWAPH